MARYRWSGPVYDVISLEWPVYRQGRTAAVRDLRLPAGARVLDVGCGTGLNVPLLDAAVGADGEIVGVDRSASMLSAASRRGTTATLRLVEADAADLADRVEGPFDAAIATYALSLIPQWKQVWAEMLDLVRPGGRIAVVDLAVPDNPLLVPVTSMLCAAGGSDPHRMSWLRAARDLDEVVAHDLLSGHIRVRTGTRRGVENRTR